MLAEEGKGRDVMLHLKGWMIWKCPTQPRPTLAVPAWQRVIHSPMGSEHGRGLQELRVHPGDQKVLQVPRWQAKALLQGGRARSNSGDCGKALQHSFCPCSLLFWLNSCRKKNMRNQMEKWKWMKVSHLLPFFSFSGLRGFSTNRLQRDTWCEVHYPFQEPVRASPLPICPDPHLPEGCDIGNLHNETVLLASLKPGGIERLRRFPTALQHHCVLIPCPCCNSHLANSLKLSLWIHFIGLELFCPAITSYCVFGKTPHCRFHRDSSSPGKSSPYEAPGVVPGSL